MESKMDKVMRWVNPIIGFLLLIIAIFQIKIVLSQIEEDKRQIEILDQTRGIAKSQANSVFLQFIGEYIDGYVYLYDIVPPESIEYKIKEIRRVGLPAIAVPSQYSHKDWLIITHSIGRFTDYENAKREILAWRENMKGWEYDDRSKTELFEKYEQKQKARGVDDLVFYYKADIITNREYFIELAKSKNFAVKF